MTSGKWYVDLFPQKKETLFVKADKKTSNHFFGMDSN